MAKRTIARERALYRSMHKGIDGRITRVRVPPTPRAVADLRYVTAIEGVQAMGPDRVQGAGDILYRHEFKPGTEPMLQRDLGRSRNNMVLSGGSYRINNEGMIEDMARRHHHRFMRRHYNPESHLTFLVLVGLALGATLIVMDVINRMLPQNWSDNKKTLASIGLDAVAIVGGAMLYKKSPTWGIALVGAGVSEAASTAWVRTGLAAKVDALMHRAPSSGLPTPQFSGALPAGQRQHAGQFQRPRIAV